METKKISHPIQPVDLLIALSSAKTRSEARRLIDTGSVKAGSATFRADCSIEIPLPVVLQVGSRFIELTP